MSRLLIVLALVFCTPVFLAAAAEAAQTPEEATLNAVGDEAPDFSIKLLDGSTFKLHEKRGSLVLINWFATWCPPCKEEMPHLQKKVWKKFAQRGLVMVSVAREETSQEVRPFVKKYRVTWPFGVDPYRAAYNKYAESFIPRNTVVGPEGKILYQSSGFVKEDFQAMIKLIDEHLPPLGNM